MERTISRIGILEIIVKRQEIYVVHHHVVAIMSGQQESYVEQHCSIEPAEQVTI